MLREALDDDGSRSETAGGGSARDHRFGAAASIS